MIFADRFGDNISYWISYWKIPMVAIEKKLPEIRTACQASGVKRLELFGSCARGDSQQDSDMDFLVEFVDPLRAGVFDRYLALHDALQTIFDCPVDLVESSAIQNRVLKRGIEADRKLV